MKKKAKKVLIGSGIFLILIIIIAAVSGGDKTEIVQKEAEPQVVQQEAPVSSFEAYTAVVDAEEFDYIEQKEVNLFKSYTDRTLIGKIPRKASVEVIDKDEVNDYCKVKYQNMEGWFGCGWLK